MSDTLSAVTSLFSEKPRRPAPPAADDNASAECPVHATHTKSRLPLAFYSGLACISQNAFYVRQCAPRRQLHFTTLFGRGARNRNIATSQLDPTFGNEMAVIATGVISVERLQANL